MHILHAIHRRRAPIPLHADIMQTQIQAVRRANHIARRAILAALFFARRIAAHDIRHLDIIRAPDIDHRILEARIMHLVRIRHDVEAADMRIVALAPEHRTVLICRRLEPHIAPPERIMRRRQHRITAAKMRIHRLRRRLMPAVRRHQRMNLQPSRIIPVVRDRRRQKPVRRMQKQLIPRLRVKIPAIIAHRIRIFLQEHQRILLQRRLITVDIHDEIIPHPCIRRLFRRLERKIIRFIISPEIEAEPRRIIVLDQKLRTRQINIAAALDRFIVVLSDNALMICHRHRIPLAPRQRLDRIRLRLITVTHPKRLLIVRRTVQDRAELPIIHRLICNHRIKMLLLDRLAVSFIDRDRLSLCVLLQHIRALLIHLRRAVALIDQRILRLTRRTEVDRPRIGCCRPQILCNIVCAAPVERTPVSHRLELRFDTDALCTVLQEICHRPKRQQPLAADGAARRPRLLHHDHIRRLRAADAPLDAALQHLPDLLNDHRQLIRHRLHLRQRILLPEIHHLRPRRTAVNHDLLPRRKRRRLLAIRLLLPRRIPRIQHRARLCIHEIIPRQQRLALRCRIINHHLHIRHISERKRERKAPRLAVALIDHLRRQMVNHVLPLFLIERLACASCPCASSASPASPASLSLGASCRTTRFEAHSPCSDHSTDPSPCCPSCTARP